MTKVDIGAERDLHFMGHALSLAQRGLGRVWPNPSVGCVIVKDGRVISHGITADGGRPHAETQALSRAGRNAAGADVYVTLEPCAHHGNTPPCAAALVGAGIKRAIIATQDPDPRVDGGGRSLLKAAGISVTTGVREAQARALNAGFLTRIALGRPKVTLKFATTLDGRIAMESGESRWITSSMARRLTHAWRSQHDAILVGKGTVEADDPMLDVRDMGSIPTPVRIIVDSHTSLNPTSRLARSAAHIRTILITSDKPDALELQKLGIEILPCGTSNGRVDLADAFAKLGQMGFTRVLCEGGAELAASLLNADLVDEVAHFQAGKIIGAGGVAAVGGLVAGNLADVPRFQLTTTQSIGPDIVAIWERQDPLF